MQITEQKWVIVLVEDEFEAFIIDDFFDFVDIELIVDVIEFETELEILVVKDSNICLRIVGKNFDHTGSIYKVMLKKFW